MQHYNEQPSNPTQNGSFSDLIDEKLSRRNLIRMGIGAAAVSFFDKQSPSQLRAEDGDSSSDLPFSFQGVPTSRADAVIVPLRYEAQVVYAWGDPVDGESPAFKSDASNSAQEQAQQAGMGHDGMEWFPWPGDPADRSDRGLLVMNHEYADQGLLFSDGFIGEMTAEKVRKSQAAHGVSVIAVERDNKGKWKVVPSPFSRRITAYTPMELTGPAAGSEWVSTSYDPEGRKPLGTFNNCACGKTPWGTYLACEENFHGVFGTQSQQFAPTPDERRYGLSARGYVATVNNAEHSVYRWWEQDKRFDLNEEPNEAHRFGYVVEIDPTDAKSVPRKLTALGRLKHENAAVTLARDGRVVVYMGDDEKNEYIYKFVSSKRYDPNDRGVNLKLLEEGTLYAARFNKDGSGQWLALVHGENGLTVENGFQSQAHICVRTRQAADRAGATMMDRPEWVVVDPNSKQVFVTLTNNSQRGKLPPSGNSPDGTTAAGSAQPPADAINPRANNIYGQIASWRERDGDPAALSFDWDLFLLAGDPQMDARVTIRGDAFGSPDGLRFDPRGILWIQTDASSEMIADPSYQEIGNNMMLTADPVSRTVRRFLTGPVGCEITGSSMTPDFKTMFVNIQHPGEPANDASDPANPTALSRWPDGDNAGRPRSATIAIRRIDGRVIGA